MAAGGHARGWAHRAAAVAVGLSVASAAVVAVVGAAPPPAAVAAAAVAAPAATAGNTCLHRLVTHPNEFARCRIDTICFLFVEEDPFIILGQLDNNETSPLNPRIPFPCTAYAERGLSGFAFKLYEQLWPSSPDLCVYAGDIDECTFAAMVQYLNDTRTVSHPGYGHALGATGALVFSPDRRRLGISSDSILEDTLLMVRRRGSEVAASGSPFDAAALSLPFTDRAWKVVVQAGACVVAITGALSAWRPTPVLGGGGRACSRRLRRVALQWMFNFVRNMAGGDLEPEEGAFAPAQALLRSIPWVFVAIVILFYEAAFIIGGSAMRLPMPLRGLTDEELCQWTVPHNTALETSWLKLVNRGRGSNPINITGLASGATARTWNTCDSAAHCFAQVTKGVENPASRCAGGRSRTTTDILVTFRPVIYSMFRQQPHLCSSLEVLEEAEDTFRFSVGWMYAAVETANASAAAVWAARREDIDFALRRARLDQTTEDTLEVAVGSDAPCQAGSQRVEPKQLVLPLVVALGAYYVVVVGMAIGYPWLRHRLRVEVQRGP